MGCYALMLKEAEQFVLSCHNFDCENSTSGAGVVAWKNKIWMKILHPPSCAHCNQQLLHIFKKSFKQATNWQWGGCTWTPPTCTWSHWPLSWVKHWTFPYYYWWKHPVGTEVTKCKGSPTFTAMYMRESKSVSYMNMLSACTWIYFCYFCHLFELIHFTWSIHCITLYYDFTNTHVAFNTCTCVVTVISS